MVDSRRGGLMRTPPVRKERYEWGTRQHQIDSVAGSNPIIFLYVRVVARSLVRTFKELKKA
jgi:hypothetical protein